MEERGLREAAANRLTAVLAAAALIPFVVALVVADRFQRSTGGGGLGAVGLLAALGAGLLVACSLVALARARLLGPALGPVLDPTPLGGPPPSAEPFAAATPDALVGSIDAITQEDHLASLLGLISRRLELLSGRQLATLGEGGRDPRARPALARADVADLHRCALRVERVATSLRVLAGDDLGPRPGPWQPVSAVAQRALAACEQRNRVDWSSLEPALVRGEVADDLALMLAEVVDNALHWADDDTTVTVLGRVSDDGYSLAVVDEGRDLEAGIRQRLNDDVWAPPSLAVNPPASFGLPVVGRLAVRHGLEVRLLEAATDGVIVKIRLPAGLVDLGSGALAIAPSTPVDRRAPCSGDLPFPASAPVSAAEPAEPAPA
jgi:signal transduction histidine kinase